MTNFSFIIPTYNRPHYLKRILSYHNDHKGDYDIVVADSSLTDYKEENKKIITSFKNLNILHLIYPASINMFHKIADAANYIKEKYCVIGADDDFIIPKGIKQSIDFLEKNPDFTVAHGFYISFSLKDNKEKKFKFYWASDVPYESITFNDPKERLNFHFVKYQATTFYAVHRTDFLKMIFRETLKSTNDTQFGELLTSLLALIYGKMKRLDVFFAARDAKSIPMITNPKYFYRLQHFIEEGIFEEKYAKFKDCLASHLSKMFQLDIEESRRTVDDGIAGYLNSNYKDVLLSKMRYILISLNAPDWIYQRIKAFLRSIYIKYSYFKRRKRYVSSTNNLPAEYFDDFNEFRNWIISWSEKNEIPKIYT